MSNLVHQVRRLLVRRGIEIVSQRQNRHNVFQCRYKSRTFRLVIASTPRNLSTALIRIERDIERALS